MLIALGSNLGDPEANLAQAEQSLRADADLGLLRMSRPRTTKPVGGPPGQADFLNAAALLESQLPPRALMQRLLDIETRCGRQRGPRWEARPLDLDLLLYGDQMLDSDLVTIPHPRFAWRRFMLEPAAEVGGEMPHPRLGRSVAELLEHLERAPRRLAIVAEPGDQRAASMAAWLRERIGAAADAWDWEIGGEDPKLAAVLQRSEAGADPHRFFPGVPTCVIQPREPELALEELRAALEAMR